MTTQHVKEQATLVEKVLGTLPAAIIQMLGLHWLDTSGKRLAKNKVKIDSVTTMKKVLFLDKANAPAAQKFLSLYAGFKNGMIYKVTQLTYKFAIQPEVVRFLKKMEVDSQLGSFVNPGMVKPMMEAIGGAVIGFGEVVLLPLDMAKIRQQNNPELKKATLSTMMMNDITKNGITGIYKGAGITILRNVPGSIGLFMFPAVVHQYVFGNDKSTASATQKTIANALGSAASLILSNPQDVIKIRLQSDYNVASNIGAWKLAKEIMKKEGPRAFGKSLGTKFFTQIPKLTIVATLSDIFTKEIQKYRPTKP